MIKLEVSNLRQQNIVANPTGLDLLSNWCRELFPRGSSGRGVKLTTHLQLVQWSRKIASIHLFHMRLQGVLLNYLSRGRTLLLRVTSFELLEVEISTLYLLTIVKKLRYEG
jgi:hypothetical protein